MIDWNATQGLLSLLIAAAAFYFARKKDTKDSTAELTALMVKLEVIGNDINEMKVDTRELRAERQQDHDAIIHLTEAINAIENRQQTMWSRIDELKGERT